MNAITLTRPQEKRLRQLEKDPVARVIGILRGCPVVVHSGQGRGTDPKYPLVSIVKANGRLSSGPEIRRMYRVGKRK